MVNITTTANNNINNNSNDNNDLTNATNQQEGSPTLRPNEALAHHCRLETKFAKVLHKPKLTWEKFTQTLKRISDNNLPLTNNNCNNVHMHAEAILLFVTVVASVLFAQFN